MRHSANPHFKQRVSGMPSSEQTGKVLPRAKVSAALTSSTSVDPHCEHLRAMLRRSMAQAEHTRRDPGHCTVRFAPK
jgi:hypothetical protein